MLLLPKKPFTWIVLGLAFYAYANHFNETRKTKVAQNTDVTAQGGYKSTIPVDDLKITSNAQKTDEESGVKDKTVNYLFKELGKTPTGQAFLKALAEQEAQKKYGDKIVSLETAQEYQKLIILDKTSGKGAKAACGSKAKVHFDVKSQHNLELYDTRDDNEPISFTIGEARVISGIENGILGMKKGGVRKIAIPPHMAYNDPNFKNNLTGNNYAVIANVELIELENGKEYKSDITIKDLNSGLGIKTALCNSKVKFQFETIAGEKGRLTFIPLEKKLPYGLEKAVLGMKVNGTRVVTIPYELLEVGQGKKIEGIKFNENQPLTLTITVTEIEDDK